MAGLNDQEDEVIEEFDFEKICRLCLMEKNSLLKIFGKKKKSSSTPLPIRIMSCASLEVFHGDGLPSKICAKCLWNVNQAYTFREQCDAANTRLQKYIHRLKNHSQQSSNHVQESLETDGQDAIPLEYLDAQITISEQSTTNMKSEDDYEIKTEPDIEDRHVNEDTNNCVNNMCGVQDDDDDEDEEDDDDEDDDDKPISQLMNYVRTNVEGMNDVGNVVKQQQDDEDCGVMTRIECTLDETTGLVETNIVQESKNEQNQNQDLMEEMTEPMLPPLAINEQVKVRPVRRYSDSDYKKDPTYNAHKKFLVLGSEYSSNKVKIKTKRLSAIKPDNQERLKILKTQGLKMKMTSVSATATPQYQHGELYLPKPRKKYAPREKNLISNNSCPILEQDGSKSKFRACTHCGKVVLGKNMGIHVKIHVGNKSHLCDICGKSFLYKKTLETHKRVHSGERPCVCKICGKTFRSSSRLSDHMSTHTGRKPFICEICAVAFRIKGHLKKHLRVHSGEKPYICTFCEKAFSDAWNMKCHLRIHTGEKPPHSCPVCGQCFLRRNKMEEHCKVTHGEQYVLPRRQYIIQRLKNDLVDNNEQLRQITEREREEQLRQETERQLLQSHLERNELVERFAEGHLPLSVPLPLPVPAFPGNIPGIFGLQ